MQGIAQKILENPGRYSVQELQQGVQHGIIPAYIAVPLIQEKVQQQKQMMLAQTMQQPQVRGQPPIAAQVMGEAQGLESMPTNLPQNYAGGGIVAFDEGGDVEDKGPFTGPLAWLFGQPNITPAEKARYRALQEQAQARAASPAEPVATPYDSQTATRRADYAVAGQPATVTTPPVIDRPAAPVVPRPAGISDLLKQRPQSDLVGSLRKEYADLETREAARQQEMQGKREQLMGSVTGEPFEDMKKSLEAEAKQFGADREEAKAMALFKAGLAMMSGTSPHALQNIGKGAMVGTEDYQAAIKDLKKAEKENQKQMAYIEQARRAEKLGDRDKQLEWLGKADEARSKRDLHGTDAIAAATGKEFDVAEKQWEALMHRQTNLDVANIHAGATLGAAQTRSEGRGGITDAQLANLRMRAMKEVDPDVVRAAVAKSLNFKKVPPAGADAGFDRQVADAYNAKVDGIVRNALGTSSPVGETANPFAGWSAEKVPNK